MIQITYKKNDGNIIQRYRNTTLPYKIGDMTSMGWQVLNVEYEYKNKYYSEYKYNILIQNSKKLAVKKQQIYSLFRQELKTFLYCVVVIIILKLLLNM